MLQLEYLVKEHIEDLKREAEQERLAASALKAQGSAQTTPKQIAAGTLIWAGERLSHWGNQLQGQQATYQGTEIRHASASAHR